MSEPTLKDLLLGNINDLPGVRHITAGDLKSVLQDLGAWEWDTDDAWQREQYRENEGVLLVIPVERLHDAS